MINCHQCGSNISNFPAEPAKVEAFIFEKSLTSRALDGRTMLHPYEPIFSVAYFDILRRLLTLTAFGKRSAAFREAIATQYGGDPSSFNRPKKSEIEYLNPVERNRLMDLVCRLFPGWPFRLVGVAHKSRNWASYILRDMNPVRYHLWEPMRRFAAGGSPIDYARRR